MRNELGDYPASGEDEDVWDPTVDDNCDADEEAELNETNKAKEQAAEIDSMVSDQLFLLQRGLLNGDVPSNRASNYLQQILGLLESFPVYGANLHKWGFLTREALYCVRERPLASLAVKCMIAVIRAAQALPNFYITKKFLFFITERLYESITRKHGGTGPSSADVIELVKLIVSLRRSALATLCDIGFFILTNNLITYESCQLYNTIFKDIYYYNQISMPRTSGYKPEILYEIQRRGFDTEVILREKDIIELRTHTTKYYRGELERIYGQCRNLRHFLELSIKDSINLLLYKRMVFMSDDFDILIREKDPRAIRAYRRSLEEGAVPDKTLTTALVQALDNKDSRLDAAIALFYYAESIKGVKGFTEGKIRAIFECLEFYCDPECVHLIGTRLTSRSLGGVSVEAASDYFPVCASKVSSVNMSFDTAASRDQTQISFDTPADIAIGKPAPLLKTLVLEGSSISGTLPDDHGINRCNVTRLFRLIKELYFSIDKRYFYKPSYLILLKRQREHCTGEAQFVETYFREFLNYVGSGSATLARVLFPVAAQERAFKANCRSKTAGLLDMIEPEGLGPEMDDHMPDALDYSYEFSEDREEVTLAEKIKRMKSKSGENAAGPDGVGVRISKNMIISDSEETEIQSNTIASSKTQQTSTRTSSEIKTSFLNDFTSQFDDSKKHSR